MPNSRTPVTCEFSLDQDGKHEGFLRLPHSVHRSAYGWLPIPIVSIKNGDGPVVLLLGGNHGDEYEGQVMLSNLAREISPNEVTGQIIMLPMANYPAAKAGLRTSPIDQGNLNRTFPGNPSGAPTEVIAHYIEGELMKRADYLFDIHSGGSSMLYIPSVLMVDDPDSDRYRNNLSLLASVQFPQVLLFQPSALECYSCSGAKRQGCIGITAEVAGGGAITPNALALLRRGVYQYLYHLGAISESGLQKGVGLGGKYDLPGETEFMRIGGVEYYCYANEDGVFEPLVELGSEVCAGQPAALIHDPETPWSPPVEVLFETNGKVVSKRIPARVQRGDCLFELATKTET